MSTASGIDTLPSTTIAGQHQGHRAADGVPARVAEAEGLQHAPEAVVHVQPQGAHRQRVEGGGERVLEAEHDVAEDVALHELGVRGPQREVREVVDDEGRQQRTGPHHRARRVGGLARLPVAVAHRAGRPVREGQGHGRPDVEPHRDEEPPAGDPDALPVQEVLQELAVVVDGLGAEVDLEVADHVPDDESVEHEPARRHHHLLPDGRSEEGRRALHDFSRVGRRARHGPGAHRRGNAEDRIDEAFTKRLYAPEMRGAILSHRTSQSDRFAPSGAGRPSSGRLGRRRLSRGRPGSSR